jgi:DNA-binding CsgD family transcriptional regulator
MTSAPGIILFDERGRLRAATSVAERLLALVTTRHQLEASLRVLAGRLALAGEHPVVVPVPAHAGGQLLLTGARAGRELTAVVELRDAPPEAPQAIGLTRRELEVLEHVVKGLPTKQIAKQLAISPWTVQQHLGSMFAKAGISNRGELTALVHARAQPAA